MTANREIERIREVYAYYDASIREQRKREPRNIGNILLARERERHFATLLKGLSFFPTSCRVLDVGCGRGDALAWFHAQGVPARNLYGVDLLPDRIEAARQLLPGARLQCANAEELDFPSETFNLVACLTVFSSITDQAMAKRIAQSMLRVLRPNGAVLWYDIRYSNPSNPHTRPMRGQDVRRLFPGCKIHLETISVVPPLIRRLGFLAETLYPLLAAIPPLRTHLIGLMVKP
ncbi:MAG: class I SAM-dependent methyltransferase [Acidobacteria bacterium]|nr:class I SAM-dependent methyltransferase [Acidobacteriota bacterium]